MDGHTARTAARRSRVSRAKDSPDRRRSELIQLLGDGLARVIERGPSAGCTADLAQLSESDATRVELPGDGGLSVTAGAWLAGRGGG